VWQVPILGTTRPERILSQASGVAGVGLSVQDVDDVDEALYY
jgi:hypothetical protein